MSREAHFEWEGREYEHSPKSADWYWALGIIGAALALAAILFGDYLLAVLVVVAAIAIALHATKAPSLHTFRVLDEGLAVGSDLYRYDAMHSFAMLEYLEPEGLPPILSIKTHHWLTPHLVIPLNGVDPDGIYTFFVERVRQDEHPHTIVDLVGAWLGF